MNAPAKIDGAALREVTVRDYKRNAERAGRAVDMADIERQALADCNTYAAVLRDDRPRSTPAPDPAKEAEKAQALEQQMRDEAGATQVDTSTLIPDPLPDLIAKVPTRGTAWSLALGRKAVICRGANPLNYAPPGSSASDVMRAILSTCEMPRLAWEFYRLYAHWNLYRAGHGRRKLTGFSRVERNIFEGLSLFDAARKYRRLVEDICDKSTGKLGSWRTPK